MRFFPMSFFSEVRGLIGKSPSSRRLYAVPALANPKIPHSKQVEKQGKVLESNEIELLRNRIEENRVSLSPSVQAYVTLTRNISNQKLVPLFMELIKKSDDFSVRGLLDAIVEDGNTSLSRVSSALVKAYANLEMFDQAINIFYQTKNPLRCGPDVKALNFLLNCMIASRENDMAVASFLQVQKLGFDADARTCAVLVRALCNEMKIDDAEAFVLLMERRGIVHEMCVYSMVIEGHRKNMDFRKALDFFLDQVAQKGRTINCVIAISILQCFCQMRKFSEAYDLFKEFRDMNVSLDRVCYNVAFDALGKLGQVEEAINLFREMTGKGIAPDVINYTTLIGGCYRQGKIHKARALIIEMKRRGKTPDIFAYSVLANGLARNGCASDALKTLDVMKDQGVKPTSFTHSMVIVGLFFAGNIGKAETLYESLEHKSQEVDASMVKGYCEAGFLEKAFELLDRLEFPLHKNVYRTLFTSLCAKDDYVGKAQYILDRMSKLGVEPGKTMLGMLIGAWYRVNNVRKARQNFKVLLSSRKIIPNLFTYTIMINTYCRLKEQKEAYALFQDMKQRGITPDVVTYTVLVNHNPGLNMKREMKALGVKRDVYYYTVLIDQQCKIDDVEKAERIFGEMIESGVEPDVVPYTVLIVSYCRNGYVSKALTLMEEMSEKGIEPTEATKKLVAYTIANARRLRSRK